MGRTTAPLPFVLVMMVIDMASWQSAAWVRKRRNGAARILSVRAGSIRSAGGLAHLPAMRCWGGSSVSLDWTRWMICANSASLICLSLFVSYRRMTDRAARRAWGCLDVS